MSACCTWHTCETKPATVTPELGGLYRTRGGSNGDCISVDGHIATLEFSVDGELVSRRYGLHGLSLDDAGFDLIACVLPPEANR